MANNRNGSNWSRNLRHPQRPLGVSLLAIFWAGNGILTLLSVIWTIVTGGMGFFTIFNLIGGLIALMIAYGLWTLKSWGFWSAVLMAGIDALQGLLALATGSISITTLIPLAFAVLILIYLFIDRSVRASFGV
jgi:uncharacterized membrane protein (DUF2068 family)